MRRKNDRGFTLIEMLVVVAIIIVVVTMSLAMLGTRNGSLKQAGSLVQATFTYARQVASSERVLVWIVFLPHIEAGVNQYDRLALCRDTGTTPNAWDAQDINDMIDAPTVLPKTVQFDAAIMPILSGAGGGAVALGMRPDGSVLLPAGVSDLTWTPTSTQADMVLTLVQPPAGSKKVFLDLSPTTGTFRRNEYQ